MKSWPCDPSLSSEVEGDLIEAAQAGDRGALRRVLASNTKFIVKVSRDTARGTDPDDAVQQGMLGFLRAIQKWDRSQGVNIRSYSAFWIKAFVRQAELNLSTVRVWTTQTLRSFRVDVFRRASKRALSAGDLLSDEAVVASLAKTHGMTPARVRGLAAAFTTIVQLDHPIDPDSHLLPQVAVDPVTPEAIAIDLQTRRTQKAQLREALATLPQRERFIIARRHLVTEPQTIRELADQLKLSRERVRQLETRALRRIREAIGQAA